MPADTGDTQQTGAQLPPTLECECGGQGFGLYRDSQTGDEMARCRSCDSVTPVTELIEPEVA